MRPFPLILSLLAAYGLLVLGANTALYHLELHSMERSMAQATRALVTEKLNAFPGVDMEVHFTLRKGHVSGVVPSEEALQAFHLALEEIAGPEAGKLPFSLEDLTHDLRRRSSFHAFEKEDEIYLRATLSLAALTDLEEGMRQARGKLPKPPVSSDGTFSEALAVPQPDAAPPPWQQKLRAFAAYFFHPGRARNAEVRVIDGTEFLLAGEVQSEEEMHEIVRYAEAHFPTLASRLENRIAVVPRVQPFVLRETDGIVSIEGIVPSMAVQERLFELVRSQGAPGQSFVNGLQVVEGVPELAWLDQEPSFFKDLLASIPQLSLVIEPQTILLEGQAPSRAVAEALAKQVKTQLGTRELNVSLSYPKPGVSLAGDSD